MLDELKPYPDYKSSSTSWIGPIPTHWDERRLKLLAEINPSKPGLNHLDPTTVVSFLPMERARANQSTANPIDRCYEDVNSGFTYFADGDVLIAKITPCFENGKGAVASNLSNGVGFGSTEFHVLRASVEVTPEFLYYATITKTFRAAGTEFMRGTAGQQRVTTDFISGFRLPFPEIHEQCQIVRFLRAAENRIKRLIRNKRRLIGLLREQKQAIINQAVTRGIDPNVPLKPSGIPWLGDIPEHWVTRRIKYIFQELDERSTTGEEVLFSMRLQAGLVPHTTVSDKPITPAQLVGYKRVHPGQMVMNRMRAALGMFNEVSETGLVSPDYAIFRPILDLRIAYFVHLFKTENMKKEFRIESKGLGTGEAGFLRLYTDRFGRIEVPIPPVSEQDAILEWIQSECASIDQTISRAEREIELMNEYRTRLISDVVTGKVDVRDVIINDDELEDLVTDAVDMIDDIDAAMDEEETSD